MEGEKPCLSCVDCHVYNCWLQDNTPVMVGLMAACPDGQGFEARFENFSVKHLPDCRRLEWLENNPE